MRSVPDPSSRERSQIPCGTAQESLSARLDGEREPVAAQRVDAHVAACGDCAQWWRQAQAQAAALRLGAIPSAPVFQVELPKRQRSWRSRLSEWTRKPEEIEVRVPQGARPGRRTGHLRSAPERPE